MSGPSRVGRLQLETAALALSDRDRAILGTLATYRLATGEQVRRLHFAAHASPQTSAAVTRRTLGRLRKLGLIASLERRVGGVAAGSAGFVWHLASAGRRLLESDAQPLPRIGNGEPSLRTVDHTLAITETAVVLTEATRAGICEVIACDPEPASWRTYLNAGGGLMTLKPDLFAATAAMGSEFEDVWFIEVDRGTESLPTIVRKALAYETYRATGREQHALSTFPLVLWIVLSHRRAEQIHGALKAAGRVDDSIHRTITFDQLPALVAGQQLEMKGGAT